MKRAAGLAGAVLVALVLALATRVARVPDAEMAPSLLPGDLIFVWPTEPRVGDIVAVVDPLDPARWTLRRVEAIGGAVSYRNLSFRTGATKRRVLDMGELDGQPVYLDGDHVTLGAVTPTRVVRKDVGVPDDAAYLGADNRDTALDSRWWGPVPLAAVQGVVLFRVGAPSTPWRSFWGARGEPAVVPQINKLGNR